MAFTKFYVEDKNDDIPAVYRYDPETLAAESYLGKGVWGNNRSGDDPEGRTMGWDVRWNGRAVPCTESEAQSHMSKRDSWETNHPEDFQ